VSSPLNYALRLLKNRLKSAWEIDQALLRRGVEEADRQLVITRLTEMDLLNDLRFARAWIHTRDRLAPRGEYLLKMELIKKGIPKEIITEALTERKQNVEDEEQEQLSEEELARNLLASKERAYAHLDSETRKRRLTSLLMRRGFSYETARRILNT
jgi:regulatory protein